MGQIEAHTCVKKPNKSLQVWEYPNILNNSEEPNETLAEAREELHQSDQWEMCVRGKAHQTVLI